jgi:hypothetical protein
MAMQTKVAEMLGVKFPGWAFSHCRDTVVAVTDEDGRGRGNFVAGARSPKLDMIIECIDAGGLLGEVVGP